MSFLVFILLVFSSLLFSFLFTHFGFNTHADNSKLIDSMAHYALVTICYWWWHEPNGDNNNNKHRNWKHRLCVSFILQQWWSEERVRNWVINTWQEKRKEIQFCQRAHQFIHFDWFQPEMNTLSFKWAGWLSTGKHYVSFWIAKKTISVNYFVWSLLWWLVWWIWWELLKWKILLNRIQPHMNANENKSKNCLSIHQPNCMCLFYFFKDSKN